MAYRVLARKWRPQDFSGVVGQKPIVTALRNALVEGRIAQAYLFSGIRGVGKTSVARILAKALNCENGPAADPCNECETCAEIAKGADFDVLEFDAATHSKVEQIRELTDSLKYGPARDRYKVVVLDEVHRLSRQAFDALLKIVEEPPEHLIFIFATTEIDAVPATILSRCQEFNFRRVPATEMTEHLGAIAESEEIEVSPRALQLIARASEGSVRDAVALLDQLATFGSGSIDEESAAGLLGGIDSAVFERLLVAVLSGAHAEVSDVAHMVESEGWDPRSVYSQFMGYCREALHLAVGGQAERSDLPGDEAERLGALATDAGYPTLLRLLHQLLASENVVRGSDSGTLALEIAWLRAAELPRLRRLEEILGQGGSEGGGAGSSRSASPAPGGGSRSAKASARARSKAPTAERKTEQPPPATVPRETPPAPEPPAPEPPVHAEPEPAGTPEVFEPPSEAVAASKDPADGAAGSPQEDAAAADGPSLSTLLDELSRRKQSLAAHLGEAQSVTVETDRLIITAPPGDHWLERAMERESNQQILRSATEVVYGRPLGWLIVPGTQIEAKESSDDSPTVDEAVANNPTVQAVLDLFGGSIESVE